MMASGAAGAWPDADEMEWSDLIRVVFMGCAPRLNVGQIMNLIDEDCYSCSQQICICTLGVDFCQRDHKF